MSSINFVNPWLLLIAIPLLILLLVPVFLTVRKDNRNFHNVTSSILHILIAFCIALSAAGPTLEIVSTETTVYVVADVSYSMHKNLDLVDSHIQKVKENLPLNSSMGVVCFGAGTEGSQVVFTRLGERLRSVKESVGIRVEGENEPLSEDRIVQDYSSTDIVKALEFTSDRFKEGVIKRIVLITDAKNSDDSDADALKSAVDALHARGVSVDAIYVDNNISTTAKEVQISGVEVADEVYQGQSTVANIYLQSTYNTAATLQLKRSYKKEGVTVNEPFGDPIPVGIGIGMQKHVVALDTEETGEYLYSVSLTDMAEDESPFNNDYRFTQVVAEKPKTLFITDSPDEDEPILREIYGENFEEQVTVKDVAGKVPYTINELSRYDEIVLSDFKVSEVNEYSVFVDSLDTVVSDLGKSLVVLGDLDLQNMAGDVSSKLSDMLPVRYGSPTKSEKLYLLVFDMSHSMVVGNKIARAKEGAKKVVDWLYADAENKEVEHSVAIIGFYGEVKMIQPKTSIFDRATIKQKIDGIETDQGTKIEGGIDRAADMIQEQAESMYTQVFLITDGGDLNKNSTDRANVKAIAKKLNDEEGVITSVLGVKVAEESTIEKDLKSIATAGQGYYGVAEDSTNIEELIGEFVPEEEETVINRRRFVEKKQLFDDVLAGISDKDLQAATAGGKNAFISGYVAATAKADATTVLTVEHPKASTGGSTTERFVTLPIYAYKKCGNGKTAAFLSDFSGEWTEKWRETNTDSGESLTVTFFRNVFSVNTPSQRVDTPFAAQISRQAGSATLEVRPAELRAGATVDVVLVTPDGLRSKIQNVTLDSSVYSCTFALPTVGEYKVEITYTYKDNQYEAVKPVSLSYLPEYDSFTTYDPSALYKMVGAEGTVSENGELDLTNDESVVDTEIIDVTPYLLTATVAMFVIDVIIRKIKWADIKGLFHRKKKGGNA